MKKAFKLNPIRTVVAGAALVAANQAMAVTVTKTLEMSCPFPLIGEQIITAQISGDFPEQIVLGDNPVLGPINIDTITTVPEKARQGLGFVDATTVTGTALSINTIHTVVGDIAQNTDLVLEDTDISGSSSGSFDVPASGVAPAVEFDGSHIGDASITVDDLIMNLVNKKADGSTAPAPVGQFTADCMVLEGQDTTLHSFEIVGTPPPPVEPADIVVSASSVDFGALQLGQTATRTITISNAGDLDLGINSVSITGAGASAFVETNSCTTVAGGSSCTIDVTYTASEAGTQAANLVINSTDADEPSVSVALSGTGQVELLPEIEVSTTSIDFGTIDAGTSATETITVSNTGGAALTVSSVSVAGAEFVGSNNCSTVAAGASCSIDVTYSAIIGASTGSVTIASDDDDEPTTIVSLAGIGEEDTPPGCDSSSEIDNTLGVEGSTYINANHGTLPLNGDIVTVFNLCDGSFFGDMHLEPTSGSFEIISGWSSYKATAQVEFEPVGVTEGTLVDGKLVAVSQAYVKVPKVTKTMFGLINWPIGGGENCRTKEPVTFTVESVDGQDFDPIFGGSVVGEYSLPKLENCGLLTEILNLKMAGDGNTISLEMAPKLD